MVHFFSFMIFAKSDFYKELILREGDESFSPGCTLKTFEVCSCVPGPCQSNEVVHGYIRVFFVFSQKVMIKRDIYERVLQFFHDVVSTIYESCKF